MTAKAFGRFIIIILVCAGMAVDVSAQVQPKKQEYLFVDTIKATEESYEEDEINSPSILSDEEDYLGNPEDSLQRAALEAMDSLSRATVLHYVPKVPMEVLADRLQCIEGEMPLFLNKKVASFIDYFVVRNRNYTQTMLERKDYYFPLFEQKLEEHGLPQELKYLAIVESGLNHAAISKSGAVGLWQFMGPTGRDMKLRQDFYFDYRLSPEEATEAACKYLKMLYRQFNDWELVLAAYNCGLGKIKNVMRKTGQKHFWDMYESLPEETRAYVPQFVAVSYAMNYAREHNIRPDADSVLYDIEVDTIQVKRCIAFDKLAIHSGISPALLKLKNPALRRHASPHNEPYTFYVPKETKALLKKNPHLLDSATVPVEVAELAFKNPFLTRKVSKQSKYEMQSLLAKHHKLKKGETLLAVAKQYHVSLAELRAWNHLKSSKMRAGQKLLVYVAKIPTKSTSASLPTLVASNGQEPIKKSAASPEMSAESDTAQHAVLTAHATIKKSIANKPKEVREKLVKTKSIIYEVQPGDTLWAITQKYEGLTVEKIMKMNGLRERKITPGQKLIVG